MRLAKDIDRLERRRGESQGVIKGEQGVFVDTDRIKTGYVLINSDIEAFQNINRIWKLVVSLSCVAT